MEMPIPNDWDGVSTCRFAVCWPDSVKWRAILSGLVESPAQGRFWDFDTGNFLELRAKFRPVYDYNFNLKEVIMACGDTGLSEVASAIRLLAVAQSSNSAATASASCGCGAQNGYVSGTVTGGGGAVPVFGTQPPLSRPNDTLPPGYDDIVKARRDKCALATAIVDGFIRSLLYLQALDLFNLTALAGIIGVALAGLSPLLVFPPAAMIVLITALGFLAGAMAVLGELRAWAIENRDDLICRLYTGESTASIVSGISDLLDGFIATLEVSGAVGWAIKTIALLLVNGDTLNKLMTLEGSDALPDGECADCECEVLLIDFSENALGWGIIGDCLGNVSTSGANSPWSGGMLNLYVPHQSPQCVGIVGHAVDAGPIKAGDVITVRGVNHYGTSVYTLIEIKLLDGPCAYYSGASWPSEVGQVASFDLSDIAGETPTHIYIYVNNSIGQDLGLGITEIRIGCVE